MSEEISSLYRASKNQDQECIKELIKRLYPLISSSINKYYWGDEAFEDMVQEGRIMVIQCINSFNDEKNVPFLGYVKSRLKYLYLSLNKDTKEISLNECFGDEKEELINLISSQEDIEKEFIIKEEIKFLLTAIEELPSRQSQIIKDYYLNEMNITEIAKKYNLTYRTILNTKSNGLKKLREEISKYYD